MSDIEQQCAVPREPDTNRTALGTLRSGFRREGAPVRPSCAQPGRRWRGQWSRGTSAGVRPCAPGSARPRATTRPEVRALGPGAAFDAPRRAALPVASVLRMGAPLPPHRLINQEQMPGVDHSRPQTVRRAENVQNLPRSRRYPSPATESLPHPRAGPSRYFAGQPGRPCSLVVPGRDQHAAQRGDM